MPNFHDFSLLKSLHVIIFKRNCTLTNMFLKAQIFHVLSQLTWGHKKNNYRGAETFIILLIKACQNADELQNVKLLEISSQAFKHNF